MNLKSTKLWDLIGIILGVVIIISGLGVMNSPPESFSTKSGHGYASFGADFYTYIYASTDAAASNTAITANNLRELGATQATQIGVCLMLLGALVVVHYGKSYFCTPVPEGAAPIPAEAPTAEEPAAEAEATEAEATEPEPEAPETPDAPQ